MGKLRLGEATLDICSHTAGLVVHLRFGPRKSGSGPASHTISSGTFTVLAPVSEGGGARVAAAETAKGGVHLVGYAFGLG